MCFYVFSYILIKGICVCLYVSNITKTQNSPKKRNVFPLLIATFKKAKKAKAAAAAKKNQEKESAKAKSVFLCVFSYICVI